MDLVLTSRLNEDLAYKIMREVHRLNMELVIKQINKVSWVWTKREGFSFLVL